MNENDQPAPTSKSIRLMYWILDAPPEITAIAEALDFDRIGFVRPSLYTKWNPKRFDVEWAQQNLEKITAALEGGEWMVTDLEGEPRRRVRYPDEYDDEPGEVRRAVKEYLTMWKWFRSHFPNLKLSEWNLSPGVDSDRFPLAEKLVLSSLDAIDISLYWRHRPGWLNGHRKVVAHAVELGRAHNKPVIVWVWERYLVWNDDHTVAVYTPVPREAIDQMIGLAMTDGVDIVALWSNTYAILAANNPRKIIAETAGRDAGDDPLPEINANKVRLMAEMRLQAGAG
jgi:hypothetical protein